MISCYGLNFALVPSGAVVALCHLNVFCIQWSVKCQTIELCFYLSSSLEQNRTLPALCKPSGFVVPFVSQLCFLFSFLKSLQDLLFELKPLDDNGDDNGDDDGAAFF